MELTCLIEALSCAASYPFAIRNVEVRQTHISAVFLAGSFVYKIKKPAQLGFLDFGTLEKRLHFCEEEVRLNRRLAPDVYLGVVPITKTPAGVQAEGSGEPIEWAVKMKRLPDEATLHWQLGHGDIGTEVIEALAVRIARFHRQAEAGPRIASFGRYEAVRRNALENFEQSEPLVGTTLSRAAHSRLRSLTEEALGQLRPLIESRAERSIPRDTHGDLHLDHVYLFPHLRPPADLAIIDCIEFNERFRFADPVADMAFLVMDLVFHGRTDLAEAFADSYFRASEDAEGRSLLSFYTAYRAAVRGKVEGFETTEMEVPELERRTALAQARAHWLLALRELELPGRKPLLVLVGGLPGTGKSTLATALARQANLAHLRSDVVRKELAGLPPEASARSSFGEGVYSSAWTERTYAECQRRAEAMLFEGRRVIVDASFGEEARRTAFMDVAMRLATPVVFLHCVAADEVALQRINGRQGDASDADARIYREKAQRWEPFGRRTQRVVREVRTEGAQEQALARALATLREAESGR
jgi:aminoglycoside phosphotransferase family enzyme/predicted kinase